MAYTEIEGTSFDCSNVGELKKAIESVDDAMPLENGFAHILQVCIFQNDDNPDDKYLDIDYAG